MECTCFLFRNVFDLVPLLLHPSGSTTEQDLALLRLHSLRYRQPAFRGKSHGARIR